MKTRAETALIAAARQSLKTGSPRSEGLLAGIVRTDARPRALGNCFGEFIEQGFNRQQATEAIARWGDPKDLPRLARLFEATESDEALPPLAYVLHREYGEQAIPYLEKALAESGQVWVRRSCAHTLIRAGRPAGFAFAADSIEYGWQYKAEILLLLRGQFQEYKNADEAAIVASLRQRAAPGLANPRPYCRTVTFSVVTRPLPSMSSVASRKAWIFSSESTISMTTGRSSERRSTLAECRRLEMPKTQRAPAEPWRRRGAFHGP